MRNPVLLLVALAACTGSPEPAAEGGRLEVQWTGADTGGFSTAATAEWCDSLKVLEVRALRGDSGLALALYPADSVLRGTYRVLPPTRADSGRPAAAIGLRLFAETEMQGFRGDSGKVVIRPSSQGLRGEFEARVRSITDADRLTLRGSFRGAPVERADRGCVSRSSARPDEIGDEPADSGID